MYACYIDESGHCGERYDANQPVEVVCGVITDITKLFKTQRDHHRILRILDENRIPISELKAKEIYRGKNTWYGIKHEVRYSVIDQLLEWADERTCKYIVCPIDSAKFFERKRNGCSVSNTLKFPYEAGAMNVVLAVERFKSGTKKNKGKTLVVFDEQHAHDGSIIKLIESDLTFTDGYTGYKVSRSKKQPPRLDEIIDVPFFSKSHLSTLIQLSDLVAFIVNRYILLTVFGKEESYTNEIKQIEKWYSIIHENAIPHAHINPPAKDELCNFYREVRPAGWTAKEWFVKVEAAPVAVTTVESVAISQTTLFSQEDNQ